MKRFRDSHAFGHKEEELDVILHQHIMERSRMCPDRLDALQYQVDALTEMVVKLGTLLIKDADTLNYVLYENWKRYQDL